ncbi:MAG: Protein GrpE [Acidimicrobiales bacterium AG-410-I20]|nr:MAG: Protein GrpE [Acidimicrobiales bacterium AG-410-I20]
MSSDLSGEELRVEVDEAEIISSETENPVDSFVQEEKDEFSQLISERDSYLDDLQRVTAEFSNFRKQSAKRNAEIGSRSQAELIEKLLPVLDACDLAIEHGANDVAPIREALITAFEPSGLQVLNPLDSIFDPTCHEAVLHEASEENQDSNEQIVIEVLRRGYIWSDHVLRPAMVKVRG